MLRAAVENQLLIYRPDADGVLQDIAGQQWVHDAGILAEYPSKGIKYAWAKARRDSRDQWVKDVPPAPDYSRLDGSPWLHGPNQERADQMRALEDEAPEEEPLALDCRVQDLLQDLTEEEASIRFNLAPLKLRRDITSAPWNKCTQPCKHCFLRTGGLFRVDIICS